MNQAFKNINIEDVLFYDLETVRKSKELDINSKEFELYQKKIRNKDTDELPTSEDTITHYKKFAALRVGYNKIVCATTGKVIDGKLYLRSFIGLEEDVIKGLYSKFQTSKYICGFNILAFDGVMARVNSLKYEGVSEMLPEQYNDSGKKSWELKKVIDTLEIFKGSHWSNSSLDEVCYHLGIESPKNGIEGSQVSEVYYNGGIDKIEEYCKGDVFAIVNIFCKLQLKPIFTEYIDINKLEGELPEEKELTVLEKLYQQNAFTSEIKKELEKTLSKKKITQKDKEGIKDILIGVYTRSDFEHNDQDSKKTIEAKTKEIEEWLKTI